MSMGGHGGYLWVSMCVMRLRGMLELGKGVRKHICGRCRQECARYVHAKYTTTAQIDVSARMVKKIAKAGGAMSEETQRRPKDGAAMTGKEAHSRIGGVNGEKGTRRESGRSNVEKG